MTTLDLTDTAFDLLMAEEGMAVVPCTALDRHGEQCPNPAKWSYAHGCPEVWLYCNEDRASLDDWMATELRRALAADSPHRFFCMTCKAELPVPLPWLPL